MPSVEDSEPDHILEQQLTDIEREELARISAALESHGQSAEQIWATGGTLPALGPEAINAAYTHFMNTGCPVDPRAAAILGARAAFAAYDAAEHPSEPLPGPENGAQHVSHPLIAFGGYATAGKDAAADILVSEHGYAKTYMSEALRECLLALNPWILPDPNHDDLDEEGHTPVRYAELDALVGYTAAKEIPEVRRLLQSLGTEVGRNILGEDTWTNAITKKIHDLRLDGPVVVTGIRYPNELQLIHDLGGISVWVERPGVQAQSGHTSETSMREDLFDATLSNAGTLDDLGKSVTYLHEDIPQLIASLRR